MQSLRYRNYLTRFVVLTAFVALFVVAASTSSFASQAYVYESKRSIDVDLQLVTPSTQGDNRFGVTGQIDTQVPQLGMLQQNGTVDFSGNLMATLELIELQGEFFVRSMQITGGQIGQSAVNLPFATPRGVMTLSTDGAEGVELANSVSVGTNQGRFASRGLSMGYIGGISQIASPGHGPQSKVLGQNHRERTVASNLGDGSVLLTPLFDPDQPGLYEIDLSIPLAGRVMGLNNLGYPVDLVFNSGALRAKAIVSLVPEPASAGLLTLAIGMLVVRRRRAS